MHASTMTGTGLTSASTNTNFRDYPGDTPAIDSPESGVIHITLGGEPGTIKLDGGDCGIHARWASSTGYRSLNGACPDAARQQAHDLYAVNVDYAFLVGDEHRDNGWRKLSHNYKGELEVRLPYWHVGIVAKCLEDYGFVHSCPINRYWIMPKDSGLDKATLRAWLAPVMAPHTRLADETRMADLLDAQAIAMGYLKRQPLSSGQAQTSLF